MSYFAKFGQQWYEFSDGSKSLVNDITKFVIFKEVWKKDPRALLTYQVKDGELPHMISNKIYDTVDYWWTVLLVNDIINFEDQWVRTSAELDNHIKNKYPFNASNDAHHYTLPNGTVTDLAAIRLAHNLNSDADAIAAVGLDSISIYDYELALNERKRSIVLIDPDYISTVVSEFERLING